MEKIPTPLIASARAFGSEGVMGLTCAHAVHAAQTAIRVHLIKKIGKMILEAAKPVLGQEAALKAAKEFSFSVPAPKGVKGIEMDPHSLASLGQLVTTSLSVPLTALNLSVSSVSLTPLSKNKALMVTGLIRVNKEIDATKSFSVQVPDQKAIKTSHFAKRLNSSPSLEAA